MSIQILCSKFLGISEVELILEQVRKYDNKLVEFVDRMLKMIGDVLEVDLTSDKKVKESLIVHLRPTIFRLRYGTPQDNALIDFIKEEYKNVFRASWVISILFEESYHLQITEDEIGDIVLYNQAAIERKKHQYDALVITDSNMGHAQLIKERIRKFVPEIGKLVFVSTHDYKTEDYWDYELIFAELKVQTKEECLQVMCEAMKKKGVVKDDFYGTVMERERNTTTTIGNGISLPHGSPTAVNEPKVAVAFFRRTGHLG